MYASRPSSVGPVERKPLALCELNPPAAIVEADDVAEIFGLADGDPRRLSGELERAEVKHLAVDEDAVEIEEDRSDRGRHGRSVRRKHYRAYTARSTLTIRRNAAV